jgi:type IV pilus assembly protein PilY1
MRRKVFLLIFIILLAFTGQRSYSAGANMTDYCYIPPVVGQQVKPNVLIVMDFSLSMQFPAYLPCNLGVSPLYLCGISTATSSSPWRYKTSETYYGYFDPNKCYSYSGSNFEESSCNCSDKIGTSNCISGNLLNWITTTRIDIARWVLTGGRTSSSGGNTFLESEGATYSITDTNLGCTFVITATRPSNRRLTISGVTCPISITNANIQIRPPDPNSIKGIIHSFCDTSDMNGQINEKCQLIMELMVFGDDNNNNKRRGEIRVGKDATISNLISGINNETPDGEKVTGEALWEAYDYYRQSNDHSYESNSAYINRGNAEKDPYYDGSGGNNRPVPCRKGFVLLISDGAWNGSVDPVVPARVMATQDLRD